MHNNSSLQQDNVMDTNLYKYSLRFVTTIRWWKFIFKPQTFKTFLYVFTWLTTTSKQC